MKINFFKYTMLTALGVAVISCQPDSEDGAVTDSASLEVQVQVETVTGDNVTPIEGRYIITYNDINNRMPSLKKATSIQDYKTQINSKKDIFISEFSKIGLTEQNIKATYGYTFNGFAAELSDVQLNELRKDPRVASIEQDFTIKMGKPGNGNGGGGDPAQVTPYGTTRVGGGTTASSNTAWVIDSGIDLTHPDLNVDTGRSISFLSGSPNNQSPNDQNGHGTHVAGTIAAIDNAIGSVGVAPGTTVVAVRVLDRRGSGSNSGVIAGVDYVAANGANGDVANMSLGGGVSTALDNAVISAASTGVKFVLAAGNESQDANNSSPARANGNNVYTISAMDINDNFANFSNFGSPVDYAAPGVAVFSTWKSGGYNTISGTSMAAPHAAGVLLLSNGSTDGFVNNDPDGNPDPIIHL
ncbi:S8 family peptidase [Dokdonia pacifica]|uniref:Peptidase inhibitor I9 n=1 Tax=Dokdonia pacifica TaxID=1627892 RepID=A0A238WJ17_9FLAO|nr:S8 family peptidase [Dokdonia pacifica]SNR46555.1 Peptidase inhibitor I9 [Dokdonia pacifica]